jgi:hypothetical protein
MLLNADCTVESPCGLLFRAAVEAWEAAFIELAKTNLTSMAREAGLRLSFSAERSVADELARESYADVGTVRLPPGSDSAGGFNVLMRRGPPAERHCMSSNPAL